MTLRHDLPPPLAICVLVLCPAAPRCAHSHIMHIDTAPAGKKQEEDPAETVNVSILAKAGAGGTAQLRPLSAHFGTKFRTPGFGPLPGPGAPLDSTSVSKTLGTEHGDLLGHTGPLRAPPHCDHPRRERGHGSGAPTLAFRERWGCGRRRVPLVGGVPLGLAAHALWRALVGEWPAAMHGLHEVRHLLGRQGDQLGALALPCGCRRRLAHSGGGPEEAWVLDYRPQKDGAGGGGTAAPACPTLGVEQVAWRGAAHLVGGCGDGGGLRVGVGVGVGGCDCGGCE